MDRLSIRNLRFRAPHGYFAFERETGNTFSVDVHFKVALQEAGQTDDLDHTLDYSTACTLIAEIMQGEPVRLIERLLQRIGESLLGAFPDVAEITVNLRKHQPPIAQECEYVEISRTWHRS
ncbi:dihydroneopterin aldolase [Cyclonatronum proteinivorum]|uniref:7,8-dihydroneopterin aldolase n=1 Tax=Cyclonatronum proteinivorum TaxID=1457365 RepID=A0A345UFP1_9BACT|nr:dihydroneopterin aldolase [Cyclonatronum proteinivorum]AXI99292.1 dihydroneopterin aldolase [Cyclonatronum proteinivorum]